MALYIVSWFGNGLRVMLLGMRLGDPEDGSLMGNCVGYVREMPARTLSRTSRHPRASFGLASKEQFTYCDRRSARDGGGQNLARFSAFPLFILVVDALDRRAERSSFRFRAGLIVLFATVSVLTRDASTWVLVDLNKIWQANWSVSATTMVALDNHLVSFCT